MAKISQLILTVTMLLITACKNGEEDSEKIPANRASKDALINAAIHAVTTNNAKDYNMLMTTWDEFNAACPGLDSAKLAQDQLKKIPKELKQRMVDDAGSEEILYRDFQMRLASLQQREKGKFLAYPNAIEKEINNCSQLINFSTARYIKMADDKTPRSSDTCKRIKEFDDTVVYFESGDKTVALQLSNPHVRDGNFFGFLAPPHCFEVK